jgi:hypothetical protein
MAFKLIELGFDRKFLGRSTAHMGIKSFYEGIGGNPLEISIFESN